MTARCSRPGRMWKLNLRADEPVRMRLRGREVTARPEFIADADEVERLLGVMPAASPRVHSFVANGRAWT